VTTVANFMDERLPPHFWTKCIPEPNSGCWLWIAARDPREYGRFRSDGGMRLAHRVAYLALVGETPRHSELDHLCRNTSCCNPAHTEPVSHQENVRRGSRAMATHCPSGHEYNDQNTAVHRGKRSCKRCSNRNRRRKRAREMAARVERHRSGL
jgi:hypothetical protein